MAAGESLLVLGVEGIGEISPGDDLAAIIAAKAPLVAGDVVVVTQKIVSKAEGRMVRVDTSDPDAKRLLAESESVRVLRRRGDLVVTETRHGFVCANSVSTFPTWPRLGRAPARGSRPLGAPAQGRLESPHGSRGRRGHLRHLRPRVAAWGHRRCSRCAGIRAVVDLRGTTDALGRELVATEICVVDEIAAAADLVMGKARGVPVAVVRGVDPLMLGRGSVTEEVVRPYGEDLFR